MRFRMVDPFGVVVGLHVAAFHRRPGDHMRALLAIDLAGMRGISMIEGIAVEVLGLRRQVIAHRCRQIEIVAIRHVTVVPASLVQVAKPVEQVPAQLPLPLQVKPPEQARAQTPQLLLSTWTLAQ